ncbi:MAG: Bug family tripartite tricarboxylate transporter substrate binding protein [Burkholderiales bacterium]
MTTILAMTFAFVLALGWHGIAHAQAYPAKPIRLLIGYAAGGGADVLARILTAKLTDALGQPITVDNRPGAGGTLAAGILAKAPADGYTLYFSDASLVTAPAIFAQLPFDPITSFSPVAGVASLPLAFVTHPAVPADSPKAFLALIKANPDKHSYGTPGVGTLHHLSVEPLKKQAGLAIQHVPYKGAAPLVNDLMGGQIGIGVTSATAALAQVKGGKLRIVGLTSRERVASAPDIPTIAEALPGYEVTNGLFVLAPAGTPTAIVATLGAALKTVLAAKAMQESYLAQGAIIEWSSPEDLATRIERDVARWKSVAKDAGIRPE